MNDNEMRMAKYREWARKHCCHDELEIDSNAPVSMCDDTEGAYVQAWVWVRAEDALEGEEG